jgi:putative membrane protein
VSTLVLCIDRAGRVAGADSEPPLVGERRIRSLVTAVGIEDPEDSGVNCLLEALRVARDVEARGEEAIVAVVSSTAEAARGDLSLAAQVDELVERHSPDAAVVVVDSADDEQVVPIVESRVRVDAVDRVIVRQARDIESTYYLLKQFLGDEELRGTVLVPLGAALLAFPVLLTVADSVTTALAVVAGVVGTFFLYKGLGIDDLLAGLPGNLREAFYSGQVSLVTYVVAVGLGLVGAFVGALATSGMDESLGVGLLATRFVYESVPWLALGALAAATGRLLDEALRDDGESVASSLMNLPFGVVAIGFVVRGFSAFFLENAGVIGPLVLPTTTVGPLSFDGYELSAGPRLAAFVVLGILISLLGVRFASYMNGLEVDDEFDSRG